MSRTTKDRDPPSLFWAGVLTVSAIVAALTLADRLGEEGTPWGVWVRGAVAVVILLGAVDSWRRVLRAWRAEREVAAHNAAGRSDSRVDD